MAKKRKEPPKPVEEPINTDIICPSCRTHIDVSDIKQAIKRRLLRGFDYIIDTI